MIVVGLLTCSIMFAVFSLETALIIMLTAPLAQVVVKSWRISYFLDAVCLPILVK
jgi:uncharacterized protein (DUF486 family)